MPSSNNSPGYSRNHSTNPIQAVLGRRRLVIASNRGPLEYHLEGGRLVSTRGSGGVVTALASVADYSHVTWVASAMTAGDRLIAARNCQGHNSPAALDNGLIVQFVVSPEHVYDSYYNEFSNPTLWFIQHQMANLLHESRSTDNIKHAWLSGYVPVNRSFAQAIVNQVSQDLVPPVVMLHDYHLYLVASYVRRKLPWVTLQHFVHIPWPEPSEWQLLPQRCRTQILEGLAANDIVGFQTRRSRENFLSCCQAFLENAETDYDLGVLRYRQHLTRARVYPISIDCDRVLRTARSTMTLQYIKELSQRCCEHTIVRVDRVDPSKNIIRGFEAFDLLLTQHPELAGQVKFLCFLVPCRTEVLEYQRYADEIMRMVATLNAKYAVNGWQPIEVFYENNYEQALAGLQLYDVLLVNPIQDGMNLVAKEGALVNRRGGTLVLSEQAGAHEQLRNAVLSISPFDIAQTAAALYTALITPTDIRRQRADRLRRIVESCDVSSWLQDQFEDLDEVMPRALVSTSFDTDSVGRASGCR